MFYRGPYGPDLLAWLFFAVFLAAVVLSVFVFVRFWRGAPGPEHRPSRWSPPGHVDPALAALRLRYARGEIGWEEFAQRAAHLGYPIHGPTPWAGGRPGPAPGTAPSTPPSRPAQDPRAHAPTSGAPTPAPPPAPAPPPTPAPPPAPGTPPQATPPA